MTKTACRSFLLLALTALVAGCATSPEQVTQRDGERCAARGNQPGSKAHDDCLSQVANQRDARTQQRHRELVERPALPPAFNR